MPILTGTDESYDSLRPYLPEDARAILDKELPRIQKRIEGEIDAFTSSFSERIAAEVAKVTNEINAELQAANAKLVEIAADIKANGANPALLAANAKALQDEVTAYKQKWEGMGRKVQGAILSAANAAGLKIPISTSGTP